MERLVLIPVLHRATHRVGAFLQERVPDVTQAEAHLLAHLHESAGASSVADLHRAWAHKRSTLTDVLDRLEKRDLARRSVLPADRRSVLVRLTAEGRRSAAAVHRELALLERAVLARTGPGALTGFGELAGALASGTAPGAADAKPRARKRRGGNGVGR